MFIGIFTALISFILLINAIVFLNLIQFGYSVLSFIISFFSYAISIKLYMIYDAMNQKEAQIKWILFWDATKAADSANIWSYGY